MQTKFQTDGPAFCPKTCRNALAAGGRPAIRLFADLLPIFGGVTHGEKK